MKLTKLNSTGATGDVSADQQALTKTGQQAGGAAIPGGLPTQDGHTAKQVRPEGTFAPMTGTPTGGNALQTRITPKRRGRGRTGALRMISRSILIGQTKKPTVRAALRDVIAMRPRLNQLVNKFAD